MSSISNLKLALAAAAGLAVFAPAVRGQLAPDQTLAAMKVGEGLAAQVYASEPMFGNPCDMDVDAKGRVWITEGWNYRKSLLRPKEGDRIMVLEDTDGDGKADKSHVFYQGPEINSALGICVLGDKVIVSCAPNVFMFEDKDGDLKADGPPKLIFTGIKGVQHDHAIHAFTFGPDGKLYFNYGNAGEVLKLPDGKPVVDAVGNEAAAKGPYRQGMVFRADFDSATGGVSNVETLGWNFRNNYEVAVDSFGTLWQSDNDDDGNRGVRINYVMEYGNFGYQDESNNAGWQAGWKKAQARGVAEEQRVMYEWHQYDPGVVPNLLNTGAGSPTGLCVYEGKLLPQQFWGQIIHCDAGPNVVRAYPVTNDGAGYKATIAKVLQGGNDKWFRPSDVCVAPDGSLMISDWYDPGVGGHATGDKPKAGDAPNFTPKGRVYRVAPSSAPKYTMPALDISTMEGAAAALASPNGATRYLGWTALNKAGAAAQPELLKMWQNKAEPRIRARALHLLARIKGSEAKYVEEAIKDSDADIRITGLRLARELKQDVIPLVKGLTKDTSPQVRREAAIALRGSKAAEAPGLWAELAAQHDGKDRWYLEALGIGAAGNEDAYFGAWLAKAGPDGWKTPAGNDIVWRSRALAATPLLAKVIQDPATPKERLVDLFRGFEFARNDVRAEALLSILSTAAGNKTILVETLSRLKSLDAAQAARVKGQIGKLLDSSKGTAEFVQLADQFGVTDRSEELLAFAVAHPTDAEAASALRMVAKDDPKLLDKALAGPDGSKVATTLGASTDKSISQLLEKIAGDSKRELAVRQAAVSALAKSKNGSLAIIDLANKGKLGDDVKPLAASLLHNSAHKDVQADAVKLFPMPAMKGTAKLPAIEKLVAMKGDAVRGKEAFTTATCITCHVVNGQGTGYGPELSEIGAKLPKDALYTSILYPNAGISMGFEGSVITTKDDDALDGIVVSDTPTEITLRRAGGINTPIKKSDIKDRRQMKLSIMPEGLIATMTQQDLVDVVEYLSTLKKATK